MNTCPICQVQNHHLAVTCTSCGGYLQNRSENLDLFATAWTIIERPVRAFRMIALSRRKNFAAAVAALAGIGFAFGIFWVIGAGEYTSSAVNLFAAGTLLGPAVGMTVVLCFTMLVKAMAATQGSAVSVKNAFAIYSYALVPVVLSVLFLLPVEVIVFGRYFFFLHPTPYSLRPVAYVTLVGLDTLCALWTLYLLWAGTKVLLDLTWRRALIIFIVPLLLLVAGIIGGLRLVLPKGVS